MAHLYGFRAFSGSCKGAADVSETAELLTSDRGEDGLVHARYPTAQLALCGQAAVADRQPGKRGRPTCEECWRVAVIYDGIDGSIPDHWRQRCTGRTVTGKPCVQYATPGHATCRWHHEQELEAA